jgi:hypothetical protein
VGYFAESKLGWTTKEPLVRCQFLMIDKEMAGSTGLEPAASAVTGQQFIVNH